MNLNQDLSVKSDLKADFNAISLKLASPERIRAWSYGEITKPETINYRTGRSERGGLFDERIFGPEKDYECYCGKYRRIRYKNIICERCGVEVTHSIVRRERFGHIELASPVAHIWFVRGIPSRLGLLLDVSLSDLEKVIYFAGYIVTGVHEEERKRMLGELDNEFKQRSKGLQDERSKEALRVSLTSAKKTLETLRRGTVLEEVEYHKLSLKYGGVFEADIGAEALYKMCQAIDLEALMGEVSQSLEKASKLERAKLQKRLNFLRGLKRAGLRPEWMFLTVIPVIPPDLRPMVALDGGRYATSDVNDLYRRVINRNNRLKKLKELDAPDVILRNEKRILQEAIDTLIDNTIRRGSASTAQAGAQAQRRLLKSLADSLRGKQGRFRQNLLGKRVDYSGRSVIVVGPELRISQCGLPKLMALELFRPFVLSKLLEREAAFNIRGASRLIDDKVTEVWGILEEVIRDKYVFLNRAPTLHRLGIQAFRPVLIEGNAIQVHPLVCSAFNADFDGDQMAVHVPLSRPAQKEAAELIAANKNILKPGNGHPIVNLKLDIVLGCYWATRFEPGVKGEDQVFGSPLAAITAHQFDALDLRARIKVLMDSGEMIETSTGRLLFNQILPANTPFLNMEVNAKEINALVERLIAEIGIGENLTDVLDDLKNFGFRYSTASGVTWGIDDLMVPALKPQIIKEAAAEVARLESEFEEGLLSRDERYRMIIKTWTTANSKIEKALMETLSPSGSVAHMLNSGARGSSKQVTQMSGIKGLIINPAGRLIEFPVVPSYKEGLSPLEYFITTHGSRKTLTDTALNTAKAGYLTRRLVYVAEDMVVKEEDCGETKGKLVSTASMTGFDRGLANLVWGRILALDAKNAKGKTILPAGHLVMPADVAALEKEGITELTIRSILTCQAVSGVCRQCYGLDLGRGGLVNLGEPIGIVAAQAIGEPGTQLTMRTKHTGGVDVGGDIVGGLPRVEEVFERRLPQNPAVLAPADGEVVELKPEESLLVFREEGEGSKPARPNGRSGGEHKFIIPKLRSVLVKKGQEVKKGQFLTDGPADLQELFRLAGKSFTEDYIINEITKIYELQGAAIARKHIELIVRQMFSRRRVKSSGATNFDPGEVVENAALVEVNGQAQGEGGEPAEADMVLLGISEVSLNTTSFISAVSFAQATKMLIKTAVRGGLDKLRGLKENVIVGRLIPAGTGLKEEYRRLGEALGHSSTGEAAE